MLFNYQAIQRYVSWEGSIEEICDLLTQLGFEVESVQTPMAGSDKLKVGKILSKEAHPKADRLSLCRVDVGGDTPLQIVCGATNHKTGDKVVVATDGQELAGGLVLERREVRGILSEGMMCSAREIALSDEHEGIIILPEDAVIGESPVPWLTAIDLNVTPNRPDCLGWIGIAREVATAAGKQVLYPESSYSSSEKDTAPIRLADPEGCPRYLGRIVRGVKVGESPKWLRDALLEVGLTPINNVVDVTNFVMMEWGHPIHAFDLSTLAGGEIIVRRARQDETITALNGQTYNLNEERLVIADRDRAVAIAGIMGGQDTEVREATADILIECAYFHPPMIRKGANALGLATDAAFRFERGVNAYGLQDAIERCVSLILQTAGGEATSGLLEAISPEHMPRPSTITLRTEKASITVGDHIPYSRQLEILRNLGCEAVEKENAEIEATTPGYRMDLTREIDLIEELARHYGYGSIPSTPPEMPTTPGSLPNAYCLEKLARDILASRGWIETKSFSFSHPNFAERLNLSEGSPLRHSVEIANPISGETSLLRTTLLASLLENLERNVQRGERSLRIYEFGKVYMKDLGDLLNCEQRSLGLAWLGHAPMHWGSPSRDYDIFDAIGVCETLLEELGIAGHQLEPYEGEIFCPGQCARWIWNGQTLGIVGRAHPFVSRKYDLPSDPILAEFEISMLLSAIQPLKLDVQAPAPYPSIKRDLSLTVSRDITAREVLQLIDSQRAPIMESVILFDRYTGKQIGEENQSLGFRITYRASDRTLTEEEITPIHTSLLKSLNDQLGAVQRGMEK